MGKYLTLKQILKKPKVDLEADSIFDVIIIFDSGKAHRFSDCTYINISPYDVWFGNASEEWTFRRANIFSVKVEHK